MTIGVTPVFTLPTSNFYDPNNNPLNIPCEGPRCIPLNLTFPNDTFTVDLTTVFNSGIFTQLQSIWIYQNGGSQIIVTNPATGYTVSNKAAVTALFPYIGTNPNKLVISGPAATQANLLLFNFIYPASYKY